MNPNQSPEVETGSSFERMITELIKASPSKLQGTMLSKVMPEINKQSHKHEK